MLEHPLSSQILVPLLSSVLAFAISFAVHRSVRGPGRFDDDGRTRSLEENRTVSLPKKRPFKHSWILLAFLIALRLYILSSIQPHFPCSDTGVEAFLPLLLAAYDLFEYLFGPSAGGAEEEDDDIALDTFEVMAKNISTWFYSSPITSLFGAASLAWGFNQVTRPSSSSTVICPATGYAGTVVVWQVICLVLDAIILTLAWRFVQWARTTAEGVRNLGVVLLSTAAFSCFFVWNYKSTSSEYAIAATKTINSLDFIHINGQSIVFILIAVALFTTLSSPLGVASVLVFLCGAYSASKKLFVVGTFEQLLKSQVILGTVALGLGFMILAYRARIYHIGLPRGLLCTCITAWIICAAVYCALVNTAGPHTIDKVMYSTRIEMSRWLVENAKISESLRVAVSEYRDRHNRRKPPPNFDIWYEFAQARGSPVIDDFRQIDEDLEPFWNMRPDQIKGGIARLAASHDISIVSIKNGSVIRQSPVDDPNVDDFVQLIQPFAKYLVDMDLPINLLDHPRVLAPWTDVTLGHQDTLTTRTPMWSWEHQQQLGQACPPNSPSREGFYSSTAQFCASCVRPHSIGQFPATADLARDLCHQPDMLSLHGFYLTNHPVRPFEELLPVFGRAKTNQYKDILIPLRHSDFPSYDTPFADKENRLFYRGAVNVSSISPPPPTLLSNGHQERLSHLVNNATASDRVTVLLPVEGSNDEDRLFQYEAMSLRDMTQALPFDVGLGDYSACTVPECEQFKKKFGVKDADVDGLAKWGSRYVLVMDGDDAPPGDMLEALRSESVPFVASVFKVHAPTYPLHHFETFVFPSLPATDMISTGMVHRAPLPLAALHPHRPALSRPT